MNTLIFGSEKMRDAVRESLKRIDDIDIMAETSKESEVLSLIDAAGITLFLACIDATMQPYRAAQQVYQLRPKVFVAGVSSGSAFPVDVEEALYSGMRHIIEAFGNPAQQTDRLHAACEIEASRRSLLEDKGFTISDSKVICVYSPKDGTGKTSLACNLAALFAKLGRKTLLMDLDVQFGDCASHLGMNPSRNLTDLLQEGENATIDRVRQNVSLHSSGLNVLPSLGNIEYAEQITSAQIDSVLNTVIGYYDFIVVDLPSALNDIVAACAERAEYVIVPVKPTIPSLRHTKRALILFELLAAKEKIHCVLAQEKKNGRISAKDAERVLGVGLFGKIPYAEDDIEGAINQGRLVSLESPRSDISKAYRGIASKIIGADSDSGDSAPRGGLFDRGRAPKHKKDPFDSDGGSGRKAGGRHKLRHKRGGAR